MERWIAALVLALPLVYLVTERTKDVWFLRWSKQWMLAIAVYAVFYGLFVWSYEWSTPRIVRTLRSLIVVVATSILVALGIAEIYLRATDKAPYQELENSGRHASDPDVGHVYLPNYAQVIQSREFRTEWRSNAQGLRADRDYGKKAPGVVRILVVGDSFTVGDQVKLEDNYPSVLQSELDRVVGPGHVEVIGAGFPGFGTVHELGWLKKFGASFEPDLVLFGMTPNDLLENQFKILYTASDGALVDSQSTDEDRSRWQERSRWYSLPGFVARTELMRLVQASPSIRRLLHGTGSVHARAFLIEQDKKSKQLYELAQGYLLQARDAAKDMGARFGVIAIPFLEQLGSPEPGQDPALFGQRLVAFGTANGIPVLDLLPAFKKARDPRSLYWREDSHCTAAGYRLIGEEASAFLLGSGAAALFPATGARAR